METTLMLLLPTRQNACTHPEKHAAAGLRVLVVDDEPDLLHILGETLGALGRYEVHTASDAKSALVKVDQQERPFDGVFLDIQMPGVSGTQLCVILRGTPGYADVPILMLTAMTDREHLHEAFIAGANDLISKPFDFEDLKARFAGERSNRFRRESLKEFSGPNGSGRAAPAREVIRSLADAISISGVERCIKKEAFEVYLRQSVVRYTAPVYIRVFKIGRVYDLFNRLLEPDFQKVIVDIARTVAITTDDSEDIFTYAGNGIFLTLSLGKSVLRNQSFVDSLRQQDSVRALETLGQRLTIFGGTQTAISGSSEGAVTEQLNNAIESVERAESNHLGWGSYKEWQSHKRSTGNEQPNNEQAHYRFLLKEFIQQGHLGWRR